MVCCEWQRCHSHIHKIAKIFPLSKRLLSAALLCSTSSSLVKVVRVYRALLAEMIPLDRTSDYIVPGGGSTVTPGVPPQISYKINGYQLANRRLSIQPKERLTHE